MPTAAGAREIRRDEGRERKGDRGRGGLLRLRIPPIPIFRPRCIGPRRALGVHFFLGVGGRDFARGCGVKPLRLVVLHTPNSEMQARKVPAQFQGIRKPPVRLESGFADFRRWNRDEDSRVVKHLHRPGHDANQGNRPPENAQVAQVLEWS